MSEVVTGWSSTWPEHLYIAFPWLLFTWGLSSKREHPKRPKKRKKNANNFLRTRPGNWQSVGSLEFFLSVAEPVCKKDT